MLRATKLRVLSVYHYWLIQKLLRFEVNYVLLLICFVYIHIQKQTITLDSTFKQFKVHLPTYKQSLSKFLLIIVKYSLLFSILIETEIIF